jgi:hypothetical protein
VIASPTGRATLARPVGRVLARPVGRVLAVVVAEATLVLTITAAALR